MTRLAFKGSYYFLPVLERLQDVAEIVSVDTFSFSRQLFEEHFPQTEVRTIGAEDLALDKSVEVCLVAGYPHKVDLKSFVGLNIHPTLLPEGRGPTPIGEVFQRQPHLAGYTIHLLTDEFDAGDIVYQSPLPLSSDDDSLSYLFRISFHASEVLPGIIGDLEKHVSNASPQGSGSRWPNNSKEDRVLSFNDSVADCVTKAKAYADLAQVRIQGHLRRVLSVSGWHHDRKVDPGTVLFSAMGVHIVAVKGGSVVIRWTK